MKKLKINWMDLETAFEKTGGDFALINEISNYFDKETGQVLVVDEMVRGAMDAITKELDEAGVEEADWTDQDVCRTPTYEGLPDWMKPAVLSAIALEYGASISRFESIPQFESRDAFEWMEAKPKRKLSAAEKRAKKERQKKYEWIFINGKQVRIKRPPRDWPATQSTKRVRRWWTHWSRTSRSPAAAFCGRRPTSRR